MRCKISLLFLFFSFFCVGVSHVDSYQSWVVADDGCPTPDQGVGNCVPVKKCKPILDLLLLSLSNNLSDRIKDRLNQYTCNYEDGVVYVCCPSGPIDVGGQTATPKPRPAITDWRSHKYFSRLPKDCGYLGDLGNKIKNGQNASLNEFPWMALLNYKSRKVPNFKCGATIVNERWILTAAHCITNLKDPLLSVRVGEHNILTNVDCELQENGSNKCNPPVQDVMVEKIIPHPDFDLDVIDNDIGLLKVSRIDLQKQNVRPVCLPTDASTLPENFEDCIVTGWGVTETGRSSNILQKVSLPIVDLKKCQETYEDQKNAKVTEKQMCAGGKDDKDSCPGDSGGPLQIAAFLNEEIRYVQLGVVSFGPRFCGLTGYPGVYTNVAYYMDWILNTIGEN